jgi:hypothetical protein
MAVPHMADMANASVAATVMLLDRFFMAVPFIELLKRLRFKIWSGDHKAFINSLAECVPASLPP